MLIKPKFKILLVLLFPALIFGDVFAAVSTPAPGEKAPNFTLPDQYGKIHHFSEYKGKIVALAFYPADFTVGCTIEAHTNSRYYKQYAEDGVVLLGISVQTPQSHKAFCEKEGIHYTLLADTNGNVAALYGVLGPGVSKFPEKAWYTKPKEYAALYSKNNPHPANGLANRVTFIIDKNGKVAYVDPNVNAHLHTCALDWLNWIKTHKAAL